MIAAIAIIGVARAQGDDSGSLNIQQSDGTTAHIMRPESQSGFDSTTNMTYHGGWTSHNGMTAYAIYWQPASTFMSVNYRGLINQFLGDLDGSPYYNILTQYFDTLGGSTNFIPNNVHFGGSWTDTRPFPGNPVLDSDIRAEVLNAVQQNGWPTGTNSEYFVFLPSGVATCLDSSSSRKCFPSDFCAYHSWFAPNNRDFFLYANMPYALSSARCSNIGSFPNNDAADATINGVSHELFETVSDPIPYQDNHGNLVGGWFEDIDGPEGEIGDKCAFNFGPPVNSQGADLVLNGHGYMVQKEWSNADSGCVLSHGGSAHGTTIGLFDPVNAIFYLRNSNSQGFADISFAYGAPNAGWLPIAGHWVGGAVDTIGLFDPVSSTFFLRNSNSKGVADITFRYGPENAGWLPIAGDWDGDGETTIGLYDPVNSIFYLRNSNSQGFADVSFAYGPRNAGWKPIVGHWAGGTADTVGLFDPASSRFFLRYSNTPGYADSTFPYGPANAGRTPLAGDWTGVGMDTISVFDPGESGFFLRNSNSPGGADIGFDYGPPGAGWIPISGNWDGH